MEAETRGTEPVWVSEALRVLGDALRGSCAPPTVWFKESSQKNLRSRDFMVPRGALKKSFPDGEVPAELIQRLRSLDAPGLPPMKRCLQSEAGLVIQLERPAVFHRVLRDFTPYLRPLPSAGDGQDIVLLNCAALHSCGSLETLRLSHLRAVLIADHLAEVLTLKGKCIYMVPAALCKEVEEYLSQLGISWPCSVDAPSLQETISSFKDSLRDCVDSTQSPDVISVPLKTFAEKHNLGLQGYDPNLDVFHVNEDDLRHVARLQRSFQEAVQQGSPCTVLHIVSCEEEFHQQKLDLLWRLMVPSAGDVAQKHLICGPVKVLNAASPVGCSQYFQLRKSQMLEASVMKYGESVQGDSWDEIINSLTSAAIKFELMATPHRSQVNLNLEEANITTKGTKSGSFVMYNCARLATMFDSYNSAVSQGDYPEFPPSEELHYSSLREEGEWLLLFNYIMMFPEVLSQSAQMSATSAGIRVTANTEAVCKFLVSLSMDFSCYYNRVHILGEPLPHLFSQMFARLQLVKAVQGVLHSALRTLHILPLTQI
ncbi:DALR anticodon-binding domain-containing protein 3 isoform X1 [Bufo bufo]|uniref:DALR anticodon-binding domain-containing protein 3 isoform X1 n=1 Tax=Bufo bufo TaxID=8384 RepID=UPI001ABE7F1F|nr:DALR anticodon-binding domain-containing protein 3 isoform X1 [Bufo bufo]